MKIICDNCGAKYSIADEKVKGKVFKIRCKKCQHIIVVRGEDQPQAEAEPQAAADSGGGGYADDAHWHVVIDRQQVGPMSTQEVGDRFAAGEVTADTYIWREGFTDWVRLSAVDEFADMARAAMVASAPQIDDGAQQWDANGGAASGQDWGGEAAGWDAGGEPAHAAHAAPAEQGGGALFGGAGGAAGVEAGGGDLFGAQAQPAAQSAMEPAAADDGGGLFGAAEGGQQLFPPEEEQNAGPMQMTGQRGENSVLFSLSNLQQLAMGGKSAPAAAGLAPAAAAAVPAGGPSNGTPEGAGSGLIDIRSMAAAGAASVPAASREDDALSGLSGFGAPVAAAPVLIPAPGTDRPKWLLPALIGGGGLILVLIGVLFVLLLTKKDPPPTQLAANVPVAEQTATASDQPKPAAAEHAGAGATDETKAGATETTDTAAETKSDTATASATASETKAKPTKRRARRSTRSSRRRPSRVAAVTPAPKPRKPARGRKRDSLDDLIDGALGPKGRKPARRERAAAADENLPDTLSKPQIQGGMRRIKGRVQSCYDKFKVPGLANVQVKIGRNGKVSSARIKGIFSGTPTGACVSAAVRSASFARFKGSPITITYPFVLR